MDEDEEGVLLRKGHIYFNSTNPEFTQKKKRIFSTKSSPVLMVKIRTPFLIRKC